MVKIRLRRIGKKFDAFYQIVIADARAPRDGRFIEKIGHYNPHSKELVIDEALKNKWLNEGAQPTDTVKTLFKKYADKSTNISKISEKKSTKPTVKKTKTDTAKEAL